MNADAVLVVHAYIDDITCNATTWAEQRAIVEHRLEAPLGGTDMLKGTECGCDVAKALCYAGGTVRKARYIFQYMIDKAPSK